MKFDTQSLLIGLLAGVATAVLCLGVASGNGLAVLLYLLSAVPIMVAGLGWGRVAAVNAGIVAAIIIALIANEQTTLFIALTTALPAIFAANWLTLSRPAEEIGGPEGKLAWFPLSDVLFRLCLMVGAAFILVGVAVGYGPELMKPVLDELVVRLQQSNPEFAFSPEARAGFDATMVGLMPFFQPLMWVLVLVGNLYLALKITQASGQLKRPPEVFPIAMRMPKMALIPFGIAILVSLMGGGIGYAGTALFGAIGAGFMLSGFAMFHAYSMGKSWRPLGLVMLYGGTALTMLPPLIMFFVGLFSLARTMPISNQNNNSNKQD